MSINWFKLIREEMNDIEEGLQYLAKIASSFSTIGNEKIANILFGIESTISHSLSDIESYILEHMDDQVKQAKQSSVNVLNAALAGIKLEKKKELRNDKDI